MGKARILGRDLELELLEVCSARIPGRSRACESLRSLKEQPVSKSLEGRQGNFLVSVWRAWHELGSTVKGRNADSLLSGLRRLLPRAESGRPLQF